MDKDKKKNILKVISIFLAVFIMVPMFIMIILYNTNDKFNNMAEGYLRKAPGFIGDYFSKYPTEEERDEKIAYISDYYISIDKTSASEKLYIIKGQDEELFHDIIGNMRNISTQRTEDIVKLIRNIEIKKDPLIATYDEIKEDSLSKLEEDIKKFEDTKTNVLIKDIKENYIGNREKSQYLVKVFNSMEQDKLAELFFYDKEIKENFLNRIDPIRKEQIVPVLLAKNVEGKELLKLSQQYSVMDPEKAYGEIGNEDNYSIDQLSQIFMNMEIADAARILKYGDDTEFVKNLFNGIREYEQLYSIDDTKTIEITKAINYLNYYEGKIKELASIYDKMNSQDVANILERLLMSGSGEKIDFFEVDNSDIYETNDLKIAVDVLNQIKKSKVSEILENMEPRKAADLSKKLTL